MIYTFSISDEIGKPVWFKTKKALTEAAAIKADIILIHMNTYGGLLESADSIRTAILNTKIPVWVFIDNNAASAGALISSAASWRAFFCAGFPLPWSGLRPPGLFPIYLMLPIKSMICSPANDNIGRLAGFL